MVDSVAIACKIATNSDVLVLVDQENIPFLQDQLQSRHQVHPHNLRWVSIESLSKKNLSTQFTLSSKANRDFRGGFWLQTANRFMLIADLMVSENLENCLHLENDNVLYFDPTDKLEAFRAHASFAIPFDRSRAIPGIVWYKDSQIAQELACYIQDRSDVHDFDVIRQFCDSGLFDTKSLPTMNPLYANSKGAHFQDYCDGYEQFGGIFDAAAIGQYLGGVDPRNIATDSRFFINETSDLNLSECVLIWDYEDIFRRPILRLQGQHVKVLSVHAHSKDSLGVSPFNRAYIPNEQTIITGERLQEKADVTITSKEVTAFHGLENIRTNKVLEIPKHEVRKIFRKKIFDAAPDEKWIESCKAVKFFFVYTHLLQYFKKYVLRRLDSPFILISHNSDDGIGIEHLDILNNPYLQKWYAQNCEINHNKLIPLPIGLKNRQWGEEKIGQILKVSGSYKKTELVYSNFSLNTHHSRQELLRIVSGLDFISKSQNLNYESYLNELAQHQFCLCPRGNGIDTHRFWEAQYLNTIPIIVKSDWTPAYSNLPILVLSDWGDLENIDFHREYIRISSSFFSFDSLMMSSYPLRWRASNA